MNSWKTLQQEDLAKEFINAYALSPEQISFEGEKPEPIFDFEALCVLREKLTDFQSVDTSNISFYEAEKEAQCVCEIVTAEGRKISIVDFAVINEPMPDGTKIETPIQAKRVARARAMRTGIRAAGVNIVKAHQEFVRTGKKLTSEPVDLKTKQTQEIHILAAELGLINGSDKSEYEKFLAETFEGRTSSSDLDDIERQRLLVIFRAMRRLNNASQLPNAA